MLRMNSIRKLNEGLLEQIKKLKDEKFENPSIKNRVNKSENEKLSGLRNHSQNLLKQIEKLKNANKWLEDKLEQLIN